MSAPLSAAEADGLYRERMQLVAGYTRRWPSLVVPAPDCEGWWIVYIVSPAGQLSWHFGPADADLFADVERRSAWLWDHHTTPEKYARLELACRIEEKRGRW